MAYDCADDCVCCFENVYAEIKWLLYIETIFVQYVCTC